MGIPQFVSHVFEEFNGIGSLVLYPSRRIFHYDELGRSLAQHLHHSFQHQGFKSFNINLDEKDLSFFEYLEFTKKVSSYLCGGGGDKEGRDACSS